VLNLKKMKKIKKIIFFNNKFSIKSVEKKSKFVTYKKNYLNETKSDFRTLLIIKLNKIIYFLNN
jgi:hypothetical protein